MPQAPNSPMRRSPSLMQHLAQYQIPDLWKSLWQLCNSVIPFILLWYLMYRSLEYSYALSLGLAILAAGFLVRLFIIQHDCGHGSFFRSHMANNTVGFLCGILTLTPYQHWRRAHAIHHAHFGKLEQRSFNFINNEYMLILTVDEYLQRSRWQRLKYRLYRHPLLLFSLGPVAYFILNHRIPYSTPWSWKREWRSVHWTNLAILAVLVVMGLTIGLKAFAMVHLPAFYMASVVGMWLFYVQHQYEGAYWQRSASWDYTQVALQGSSYYKLPRILQWFTGNIGLHHVHHMSPKIRMELPTDLEKFI
jgi:acyl-lipid omega-6 desaturase (Delta-12 desaturase)